MSLIRKHGAVLQAWACLDLVFSSFQLALFISFRLSFSVLGLLSVS